MIVTSSMSERPDKPLTSAEYYHKILNTPVYDVANYTQLDYLPALSKKHANHIHLKREDLQAIHSFKIRGAYNKIHQLTSIERQQGVVTASAGNHGQGVALAAKKFGCQATIVMPITTPDIKIESVKRLGASVLLSGSNYDMAAKEAKRLSSEQSMIWIAPFDDVDVIAGQATVAKEILEQQSNVDYIFIPVGGGLLAGMAVYIKHLNPNIKLIGVEPDDSGTLLAALNNDQPTDLDSVGLFVDGVAVKRFGEETFRLVKLYCDGHISVSNDAICSAIKDIFENTRAIAEPAGALALAGLIKYVEQNALSNKVMTAILSGANTNFQSLRYISERCELSDNKEILLGVSIPEEKGSYLKFCKLIGGLSITEFNYRFAPGKDAHIFVGLHLNSDSITKTNLINKLQDVGYTVQDLSQNELAKLHLRYMVGGRPNKLPHEILYRFEFPEHPGALMSFLQTLGERWNISLFHYRSHGAASGQVLAGFDVPFNDRDAFDEHLQRLNYPFQNETDNPAYQIFLQG